MSGQDREARLRPILARYRAGDLSAPMALMHLLLATRDLAAVEAVVVTAGSEVLTTLLTANRDRIAAVAALLDDEIDHDRLADNAAQGVAEWRLLFDRLARQQPEAGVALYSLGSPELLRDFTDEIAQLLREWGLVAPRRLVLDLGCGIGRIAAVLAPCVATVLAVDISPEMVREAQRRHGEIPNLHFAVVSGGDLATIRSGSFDLVLAVDSFPYIVQCGAALADRMIAEAARILAAEGDLVIFNFSYRDLATDRREIAHLAARHGLDLVRNGLACCKLWDGVAFHLRRTRRRRS